MATLLSVMLMAARYEKAKQAGDWNKVIALEKEMVTAAIELENETGAHPFMTIVRGRNSVRKARKQELLNL